MRRRELRLVELLTCRPVSLLSTSSCFDDLLGSHLLSVLTSSLDLSGGHRGLHRLRNWCLMDASDFSSRQEDLETVSRLHRLEFAETKHYQTLRMLSTAGAAPLLSRSKAGAESGLILHR